MKFMLLKYCNFFMFSWLFLYLLAVIPITTYGEPLCNDYSALSFAFARVSPIQVFNTPDFKSASYIDMEFGRAYPIIEKERGKVRLCIKGNNHWVKKSHIMSNESAKVVIIPQNDSTKRPKIIFWRSQERLSAFLTGYNISKAPPDYEEFPTYSPSAQIQFPVYQQDLMEMFGSRQIEVASLLVPFPTDAIEKYQKFQLYRKTKHNINMVILVDVSGSTAGFIDLFLNRFKKTYTKFKLPMLDNIMLLEFGGDGSVSKPKNISFTELTSYSWKVRSAPKHNKENYAVLNAITLAAKQVKLQGVRPPLLVLAGGDVDIQAIKDLNAFGYIWIVQLTPEIQDALKKSANSLGRTAKFVEFSPDNAVFLTRNMANTLDFKNKLKKAMDYSGIAKMFVQMGILPFFPYNLETEELASLPIFVSKKSDWFAINLWTVVNGKVLKFKKVP